jgi:hypothetical protein
MTTFNFPTFAKQNNNILEYSQTMSLFVCNKSHKSIMIDSIKEEQFIKIASQIRFKSNRSEEQRNERRAKR